MDNTPIIFTVMVFQMVDGLRRLDVHYVAGFASADAEARIKARAGEHLKGADCYIMTDEIVAQHDNTLRLYATRYANEASVSDEVYKAWVRTTTRASFEDGEMQPASFRRMGK